MRLITAKLRTVVIPGEDRMPKGKVLAQFQLS